MRTVLTAAQSKAADAHTIQNGIPSLVLMERAALSVVQTMRERSMAFRRAVVVCGTGNNGGDGLAIARILSDLGNDPVIVCVGDTNRCSEDRTTQENMIRSLYQIPFHRGFAGVDLRDRDVIIDAVFGIGLSRVVTGEYADVIDRINDSGLPVVAVDMPSGIHTDTGEVLGTAVRADLTVTFTTPKPGLLLYPGRQYAGDLHVTQIGIRAPRAGELAPSDTILQITEEDLCLLPARDASGNKGTFGKVLVIAGSRNTCGAALLAAKAALRSGAGMVRIYTEETNRTPLAAAFPEALLDVYNDENWNAEGLANAISWADTILIGPGMGTGTAADQILTYVLEHAALPLVLDADAINLLAENAAALRTYPAQHFITPHMKEMSRLTGTDMAVLKSDPIPAARRAAAETGGCVILKDASTVVAAPEREAVLYAGGTTALATAGSGDVLAGLIAGILAQTKDGSCIDAALAVCLHGLCGEEAARRKTVRAAIAGDLTDCLPAVFRRVGNLDGIQPE